MNIKHVMKILTFATFQQPYPSSSHENNMPKTSAL